MLEPRTRNRADAATMTLGEAVGAVSGGEGEEAVWKVRSAQPARLGALGADRPLVEITAGRIAEYKIQRARTWSARRGAGGRSRLATLNRELAVLRHLFTLAVERWEMLDKAPRSAWRRNPRAASLARGNGGDGAPHRVPRLTEQYWPTWDCGDGSGMRQGELLELDWRAWISPAGVVALERTKSGQAPRGADAPGGVYGLCGDARARIGQRMADKSIRTAFRERRGDGGLTDFTFHGAGTISPRVHEAGVGRSRPFARSRSQGHQDTLRYAHLSPATCAPRSRRRPGLAHR